MFGLFRKNHPPKKTPAGFPPVPEWQPAIEQPLDRTAERFRYYTDGARDFALFQHGTCVILEDGLSDEQADRYARGVLDKIFHAHPDMSPRNMEDGNILVGYGRSAANIVLVETVKEHWSEIEQRHQQALARGEVLMTPLGPNRFDDFGKKALFGRCFMFMDAQRPKIVRIIRKDRPGPGACTSEREKSDQ